MMPPIQPHWLYMCHDTEPPPVRDASCSADILSEEVLLVLAFQEECRSPWVLQLPGNQVHSSTWQAGPNVWTAGRWGCKAGGPPTSPRNLNTFSFGFSWDFPLFWCYLLPQGVATLSAPLLGPGVPTYTSNTPRASPAGAGCGH